MIGLAEQGSHSPSTVLFSGQFLSICLASFAFFFSLFLIMPVLPFYVLSLGGGDVEVGVAVGLFTASALAARLFVGREIDRRGHRLFMLVGTVIFTVASGLYLLPHTVRSLYLLRLAHGTGIAAFTTASTTLVANMAPPDRRGEALSLFGAANNVALAVAPAVGSILLGHRGFSIVFTSAALTAAVAFGLSLRLSGVAPASTTIARVPPGEFVAPAAVVPALVLITGTTLYGMVTSYLPLLMDRRGLGNPGLYFGMMAVGLIASRLAAGRISDALGRRAVILPGAGLMAAAMALIVVAASRPAIAGAAFIHGLGFGAFYPGLLAFTVDRTPAHDRGKAMAVITAAFDVGVGTGSAGMSWVAAAAGLPAVFKTGVAAALAGIAVFEAGIRRLPGQGTRKD